jgi:hypothetical protein
MIRISISLLIVCLLCEPLILLAAQSDRQSLFRIERNTNANIVQYDANISPDGKLNKKEPVVAYWIRLADKGQVKELSWIQRKFAYGFSADFDRNTNSAVLDMAADLGRSIKVHRIGGSYRATADINGKPSRIEKIYIHATGKGLSTTVDYIELHGMALDSSDVTYERFVP